MVVKSVVSDGPDPVGVISRPRGHGTVCSLPDVPEPHGAVIASCGQLVLLVGVEVDRPEIKTNFLEKAACRIIRIPKGIPAKSDNCNSSGKMIAIDLWKVKLVVNVAASVGFLVGGIGVLTGCPFSDLSEATRYV